MESGFVSVLRGRWHYGLTRLSLSGGALILGNKDDLAGQFSRHVKRKWPFTSLDQNPLTLAQLRPSADALI